MTLVTVHAAEILLGTDGPVDGTIRVEYRDATGPFARIVDDTIRYTGQISVPIVDGEPSVPLQLQPTDGTFFARITLTRTGGSSWAVTRDVAIPNVASIDIGDLVEVDPATYQPVTSLIAEWTQAATTATAARDQAVTARDTAVTARGEAVAASTSAQTSAAAAAGSAAVASQYLSVADTEPAGARLWIRTNVGGDADAIQLYYEDGVA